MNLNRLYLKTHQVAISLYVSLFVLVIAASNINWGGQNWEDILEADARGYYAYLPAVFIYQDVNFGFFENIELQKYPRKHLFYDYRKTSNGRKINKYFCGTAIAEIPFFALGHLLTILNGNDADGYTKLYSVCINFGAIVYLWIAFVFIIRILKRYQINDGIISFLIPVIIFGTNIFLYVVMDPGMSHVYSLAFFAIFIHYGEEYFNKPGTKYLFILATLMGIIILIRPSNVLLFLALPFLAGSFQTLKAGVQFLFKKPLNNLMALIPGFAIIGIQLLYYKIATGNFLVYAYSEERFYFFQPHVLDLLFSYRRGFFLYTPIFLVSMGGIYFLYKQSRFKALTLILFLYTVVFVLSTWWMWWYGGGFSVRVFMEYYPFLIILLALFLQAFKPLWLKRSLKVFCLILVLVCQIQIYQYRHYQIHWENTTKAMYWKNFLRIDRLL